MIRKIEDDMANALREEIDWEILSDLLVECGWSKVQLSNKFLPVTGVELHEWREKNLTGSWKAHGSTWLFENQNDAVIFTLRWA